MSTNRKIGNIHPGKVLQEEFLVPLHLSQYRISKDIKVPPRRINEIVHGKRAITADTALRLSKYFGTSPQFWLNLQSHYELENEKDRSYRRIDHEVHPLEGLHKKAA
jgi:addiction module HigA family antidote